MATLSYFPCFPFSPQLVHTAILKNTEARYEGSLLQPRMPGGAPRDYPPRPRQPCALSIWWRREGKGKGRSAGLALLLLGGKLCKGYSLADCRPTRLRYLDTVYCRKVRFGTKKQHVKRECDQQPQRITLDRAWGAIPCQVQVVDKKALRVVFGKQDHPWSHESRV